VHWGSDLRAFDRQGTFRGREKGLDNGENRQCKFRNIQVDKKKIDYPV
jgi:hypothetical protein